MNYSGIRILAVAMFALLACSCNAHTPLESDAVAPCYKSRFHLLSEPLWVSFPLSGDTSPSFGSDAGWLSDGHVLYGDDIYDVGSMRVAGTINSRHHGMIVNEAVGLVARLEKQLVVSTDSKDSLRPTEQQLYLKVRDMKLREVCSVPVDLERYSELLSDSEWQVSTRLLSDFGAVLPDIVSVGSESVLLSISGRTCTVLIREDYTHGASVEWASTYPCFVYSCENSVELLVVGRISDEYIQDSMHMPTLSSVESVFFLDVTTPMPVVYEPVNVDALEYAVFANCVWLTGTEVLVASSNPSEIAVFDFGKDKITARWPLADYKKVSCHLVSNRAVVYSCWDGHSTTFVEFNLQTRSLSYTGKRTGHFVIRSRSNMGRVVVSKYIDTVGEIRAGVLELSDLQLVFLSSIPVDPVSFCYSSVKQVLYVVNRDLPVSVLRCDAKTGTALPATTSPLAAGETYGTSLDGRLVFTYAKGAYKSADKVPCYEALSGRYVEMMYCRSNSVRRGFVFSASYDMQDAICFERGEITAHIEDDKIIYKGDTFEIPPTLVSVFKEGRAKLVAGDLVVHDTKIYSAASGETWGLKKNCTVAATSESTIVIARYPITSEGEVDRNAPVEFFRFDSNLSCIGRQAGAAIMYMDFAGLDTCLMVGAWSHQLIVLRWHKAHGILWKDVAVRN